MWQRRGTKSVRKGIVYWRRHTAGRKGDGRPKKEKEVVRVSGVPISSRHQLEERESHGGSPSAPPPSTTGKKY